MKKINITEDNFSKLKKLNVKSLNIESDLYILDNKYLIKKFIYDDVDYLKEKEHKIDHLLNQNMTGVIPVLSKITIDNKFVGYIMPFINNSMELKELNNMDINYEQLIEIMYKLSKSLEIMHNNNIIYGDISDSNIILNTALEPYFIDIDGALVNGIGQSNIPKLLYDNKFVDSTNPTIGLDILLLNILFVNMLCKEDVSKMTKDEIKDVINDLNISNNLKKYFSDIPNGLYKQYATKHLEKELKIKRIK